MLTDFDEFPAELLVFPEFGYFPLRLAHGGWGGQGFGDGLAMSLVGQAHDGAMARVIGAGTVTGRFSAAEYGSDDRAWAHVLEIGDGVE
jgi:hypothetical protein